MLEQQALDRVFHALADPSRRAMIERLGRGPASVSELAEPLDMSLAAVVQHLQVLEASGVGPDREGRPACGPAGSRPAALTGAEELDRESAARSGSAGSIAWASCSRKGRTDDRPPRHLHPRSHLRRPRRAEVWRAWTEPELRARAGFHGPEGWQLIERTLDLRVGGRELLHGRLPSGKETRFVSTFHVIVPGQRLVSAYDMHHDSTLLSVSLATLELEAAGPRTRDALHRAGRVLRRRSGGPGEPAQRGTALHLDRLGKLF